MVASPGTPDTKPYGLHRVWITPYLDVDGTILGPVSYRLPIARTLAFTESEDFDTLDGDDKASVAVQGKGATVDGSLEAGGLDLTCFAIFTGAQLIEEGIAPNIKRTILKRGSDQRGYWRAEGQVISNGGGDNVARIFRCKANGNIQADMKYGTFMVPSIDFLGTPMPGDDDDYLYAIEFNQKKTTLGSTPVPNPLPIPSNVTFGAVGADSVELAWVDVPTADSYKVQQAVFADGDFGAFADVPAADGGEPTEAATTVTGLAAGQYQFRVAGVFNGATGPYSSPITVTVGGGAGS